MFSGVLPKALKTAVIKPLFKQLIWISYQTWQLLVTLLESCQQLSGSFLLSRFWMISAQILVKSCVIGPSCCIWYNWSQYINRLGHWLGLSIMAFNWFKSHLQDRDYFISVVSCNNNVWSSTRFISRTSEIIKNWKVSYHMYTDNTHIYIYIQ